LIVERNRPMARVVQRRHHLCQRWRDRQVRVGPTIGIHALRLPDRERLFESQDGRSPDAVHAAVVAAVERPDPAAHLVAFMA